MVIPESVTSVGYGAFVRVGKVEVSSGNPGYCSIDGNLYSKDRKTLIHYDTTNKASSFKIPESVTSIGDHAFYRCRSLTSMVIPDSVTSIGKGAFSSCWSLASVEIPKSLTSIGASAFSFCRRLASLRYNGTKEQWKKIQLDEDWKKDSGIRSVECTDGDIKFLF